MILLRKIALYLISILIASCFVKANKATLIELSKEKYNLSFERDFSMYAPDRSWIVEGRQVKFYLDTINKYDGAKSVYLAAKQYETTYLSYCRLNQKINLPQNITGGTVSVKLRYPKKGNASFNLLCKDTQENIVQNDSIIPKVSNEWTEYKIKFNKQTAFFNIQINLFDSTELWIDDVQIECKTHKNNRPQTFTDPQELLPGFKTHQTIGALQDIQFPKDKDIIAIGESAHTSHELAIAKNEIIKSLVKKNECKLILLEASSYMMSLVNDYIHSKIDSDGLDELNITNGQGLVYFCDEFVELIEWLRNYNSTASQDVNIIGYDVDSRYYQKIKEYIRKNKRTIPCSKFLKEYISCSETIPRAFKILHQNKDIFIEKNSEENYFQLHSWLIEHQRSFDVYWRCHYENIVRDSITANYALNMIHKYHRKGTKVILHGHLTHLNKINITYNIDRNFGAIMNERLGGNYYVISLNTGTGKLLNCKYTHHSISHILGTPEKSSLERRCLLSCNNKIISQSTKLYAGEKGFMTTRFAGVTVRKNQFYPMNIEKRFDHFIFIPTSTHLRIFWEKSLGEAIRTH
ncbi:hypothetical protein EYV94_26770 [Puteibacter caeruleilacunae]|nr:hypothetical protein EYV94_26770 [Puteibacter caeruleilacunae]